MITDLLPTTEQPGTNLTTWSNFDNSLHQPNVQSDPDLLLRWGVYQGMNTMPIDYGHVNYRAFASRFMELLKLERQHRERVAAVALDPAAQELMNALNRETSIKWDDLPDKADCDWSEASRAAALLAGANLCDVSPTRIRLSEYGDKLLAEESAEASEALSEVAS